MVLVVGVTRSVGVCLATAAAYFLANLNLAGSGLYGFQTSTCPSHDQGNVVELAVAEQARKLTKGMVATTEHHVSGLQCSNERSRMRIARIGKAALKRAFVSIVGFVIAVGARRGTSSCGKAAVGAKLSTPTATLAEVICEAVAAADACTASLPTFATAGLKEAAAGTPH